MTRSAAQPGETAGAPRLLDVRRLSKSFGGVAAVRDVSLSLGPGDIVALIGPNGAGKSTCFNLINGQLRPDAGSVRIAGRETVGLAPRQIARLGVGRTFQIAETFRSMTVRENVQIARLADSGELWRFGRHAARRHCTEAEHLLALVGLKAQAERPAGELAYGDVKRLELAVALANRPVLLLMDEPTAGMAASERAALMALTARITRERRIGVLFTEHDMDVVFRHADRLMVLDRGALIAEGPPDTVRRDPRVRAIYLGEAFAAGAEP